MSDAMQVSQLKRTTKPVTGLSFVTTVISSLVIAGCSGIPIMGSDTDIAATGPSVSAPTVTDPAAMAPSISADQRRLLAGARQLGSGDILAVVVNNTLNHGQFREFYSPDGVLVGVMSDGTTYEGSWDVVTDGNRICTTLPVFNAQGCAQVFATAENQLLFVTPDGRITTLIVAGGNQVSSILGSDQAGMSSTNPS